MSDSLTIPQSEDALALVKQAESLFADGHATAAGGDLDLARQQAGHTDARLTTTRYIDPRIANTRNPADVLPTLTEAAIG